MREPTRAVKLHTDAIAFFAPNRHTQAGKVGSTWLKRPASTSGTYSVRARARRAVGSRRVTREGDLRWSCAERDGHGSGSVKCTGQTSFHCPSRVVLSSGDIARPSGSSPGQNSEPRKNTWLCPLCGWAAGRARRRRAGLRRCGPRRVRSPSDTHIAYWSRTCLTHPD